MDWMLSLWVVLITLLPSLELRASIPFGILSRASEFSWSGVLWVVGVAVAANILLGWVVFRVMAPCFAILRCWPWFDRRIQPRLEKTRLRLKPYVDKYGEWGTAVFIGIPLPGSGVYTGALAAYLLGLDRRRFAVATVLGVLMAAAAVTVLTLMIQFGVLGENSLARRIFVKVSL